MATKTKRKARKRVITDKDLYNVRLPIELSLSPDESRIAYIVEQMNEKEKRYDANLHVLDLTDGTSRQFTHGEINDRQIAWSHEGDRIAFVSTRDKKTGIYVMPADGGSEVKQFEGSVMISGLQWTPDDKSLVFSLRYQDAHFIEDEKEKGKPPVYRHITKLFHKMDGMGYLPERPTQIARLDLDSGDVMELTKGKRDNENPHVSPDGKWVAYVSNRSKDDAIDSLRNDLFIVPLKGGKERKVPTLPGPVSSPRFSPDSKTIAYLGHDDPRDAWGVTNTHVWKVGVSGKPACRDLIKGFDRMATDSMIADLGEGFGGSLAWSADGRRVYFRSSDSGTTSLYYVPSRGGKPTRIYKGNCHVKAFSVAGRTKKVALIRSDLTTPGEIEVAPVVWEGEKKTEVLTDMNPWLRKDVTLGRTREVWCKSFDGTKVQGWLITPPNMSKSRRYPAILEIHGGPRAQYGFTFFHEMQWLAAQGYVVLYTNPRGGLGRGRTWAESIAGGWGDLDYKDCMAATDWLENQKFVDQKRIGVTGGSYGGYMTNWMIGHTNRFKAAVTQRCVTNLVSMAGSSDIGFALEREFGGWHWENFENYLKCSPLTYFKNVKTPVLIIHSEQDLRCPLEQAGQMFTMLKALGKRVEMVQFPDEPHGLSRHGRPDRRIERLNWIRKWFDKYLKK